MTCTSVERTGFLEPSFGVMYGTTAPYRVHADRRYKASIGRVTRVPPVQFTTIVGLSPSSTSRRSVRAFELPSQIIAKAAVTYYT